MATSATFNTFDSEYDKKEYLWSTSPSVICREALKYVESGKSLDIGSGEGRDVVHLAQLGFDSQGIEVSASGIAKAQMLAKQRGVEIKTECNDLRNIELTQEYDLITSCSVIHFLNEQDRGMLFEKLKSQTKVGGINAILIFTTEVIHEEYGEKMVFFEPGQLIKYYSHPSWKIIEFKSYLYDCNLDGTDHQHSVETIIAKRMR